MQVIPLDKFPRSFSGLRRFQTAQILWEEEPELRPDLALSFDKLCRSINRVVTAFRMPPSAEIKSLKARPTGETPDYAMISLATLPDTFVRRKSRPA